MTKHVQLELKGIHKTFEAGTVNENHVLKGLSLTLYKGDFVTVIGGNGAGKSTMMNTITGSYRQDAGSVIIDGEDVSHLSDAKRAGLIGYVFQDPKMGTAPRLSVQQNLAIASKRGLKRTLRAGIFNKDKVWMHEALKRLDLGLENRLTAEVGFLSGGQRQALTLLMATLRKPKLLLLDEHTAALDPKTSEMVLKVTKETIEEQHLTALMITHNMADALRFGNRLIMLHQGRVILDLSQEEKANMTVVDLLNLFKQQTGEANVTDEMLLA